MTDDDLFADYAQRLTAVVLTTDWGPVQRLGQDLREAWLDGRQCFLCGNGGSAGNAVHLANDLVYGIGGGHVPGLRAHALTANSSILTCLGNDRGYEHVFSLQLKTLAVRGDLLLVLSGSGNSPNILDALRIARDIGLTSYALLGFDGGQAKSLADTAIHFPVHDMQIAEDLQLVAGHMAVQFLMRQRPRPE